MWYFCAFEGFVYVLFPDEVLHSVVLQISIFFIFRDAVIYAASVESKGLEPIIEMLSEVVWRPLITQPEVSCDQNLFFFILKMFFNSL